MIVNLASKEYSKCIEKYLTPDINYITCVFGEYKGDKVIEKGTYAKDGARRNGSFSGGT